MSLPTVSVIIPTYNRKDSLLRTLESLARQTYPADQFEVIVVDDGSDTLAHDLSQKVDLANLRLIRQDHMGGTAAKNAGAAYGMGDILMFIDDDITVMPRYISLLVTVFDSQEHAIVSGSLIDVNPASSSVSVAISDEDYSEPARIQEVPFLSFLGGFFAIRRTDFWNLRGLQDLAPGWWPNWEDVDFAYRAHGQGYRFFQVKTAIGCHWDANLMRPSLSFLRWERAARSSMFLFEKHPDLRGQIPMFRDKGPIQWRQDPPRLILRKLARQVASSHPAMWAMERSVPTLERRAPQSRLLTLFYRWIISGYIYRGYREGLRAASQPPTA